MTENAAGPYAYDGLERILHEKARLGMLTSLIAHPKGLSFSDLKQLCGLTDGNLSRHLKVLREENIVVIEKAFVKNRPLTTCRLTNEGRQRFLDYLTVLEQVVKNASELLDATGSTKSDLISPLDPSGTKPV